MHCIWEACFKRNAQSVKGLCRSWRQENTQVANGFQLEWRFRMWRCSLGDRPGFEPGTLCTRSANRTTRPKRMGLKWPVGFENHTTIYAVTCQRWLVGLGVWFSLWVREVPGSNPGRARDVLNYKSCCNWNSMQIKTMDDLRLQNQGLHTELSLYWQLWYKNKK